MWANPQTSQRARNVQRTFVREFTLPSATRHVKLMPMKDGIVELRQKGASLGLIRELLATVGVPVSTATIAQVLAKVSHIQGQHDNIKHSLSDALPF